MTDFQQHLFDVGNSHQTLVNDQMYPGGIQEVFSSEEEGFHRSLEVMAAGSMDLYLKCVDFGSTDETSKQKIIIYNEDDCFATMHIYDWVMAQEA